MWKGGVARDGVRRGDEWEEVEHVAIPEVSGTVHDKRDIFTLTYDQQESKSSTALHTHTSTEQSELVPS